MEDRVGEELSRQREHRVQEAHGRREQGTVKEPKEVSVGRVCSEDEHGAE